jgi:hypothetical protein
MMKLTGFSPQLYMNKDALVRTVVVGRKKEKTLKLNRATAWGSTLLGSIPKAEPRPK